MNKLDEIVEKIINVDKANLSSYFEKTMWTRFENGAERAGKKTAYYYKMCQSPVLSKRRLQKNIVVSHVIGSDHMRGAAHNLAITQ